MQLTLAEYTYLRMLATIGAVQPAMLRGELETLVERLRPEAEALERVELADTDTGEFPVPVALFDRYREPVELDISARAEKALRLHRAYNT